MLTLFGQPISRLGLSEYLCLRDGLALDPRGAADLDWARNLRRPDTPEDMVQGLVHCICHSGMAFEVASKIFDRIIQALRTGQDPGEVFRHEGKVGAIRHLWSNRALLFQQLGEVSDADLPEWCRALPWIGGITCFHAAKNLGCTTVAKPDRWLVRVASLHGSPVQPFCEELARLSGDNVATVDLVIWWGCANGHLIPGTSKVAAMEELTSG